VATGILEPLVGLQCWIIGHVVEPRMPSECYQPIVPFLYIVNDWFGFMWPLVHWFLCDSRISHLQQELLDWCPMNLMYSMS
jgi:hypothetical protein